MTQPPADHDEGGEAPCMAHLFEEPSPLVDGDVAPHDAVGDAGRDRRPEP